MSHLDFPRGYTRERKYERERGRCVRAPRLPSPRLVALCRSVLYQFYGRESKDAREEAPTVVIALAPARSAPARDGTDAHRSAAYRSLQARQTYSLMKKDSLKAYSIL
ncbi:hypothetical protein EVAR_35521_1 [Eumeta japonica]|uniref:Uncharacterized protein n=1 Tax=Eumeta variegata TaxID=151549 RepID=A0A4C1X782_EUMVA|nr:hypothetical protein EVAR_35521_1 [Eumeta japonica]